MATTSMTEAGLSGSDSSLLTNVLREAIFTASEKSIAGSVFNVYDMTTTPGLFKFQFILKRQHTHQHKHKT